MKQRALKLTHCQFQKLPWKVYLAGCFLLFFMFGILAANWVGRENLIQYGMLNEYYVGQLAYTDIDSGAYFGYLLKKRLRVFGLATLSVYTRFGIFALSGVVCWYAFSLGYLFVDALVSMGFPGMALVFLSVFPQVIGYALAYFALAKAIFGKSVETAMPIGRRRLWQNPRLFFILSALLCMLSGVWMEGYLNPVLLKHYIRRM